jgi:hypothetical protein
MKGSPFRTRRQFLSPFMLADPALGAVDTIEQEEVLQEPIETEALQETSTTAEQMQDGGNVFSKGKDDKEDKYTKKIEAYKEDEAEALSRFTNISAEDIDFDPNIDPERAFDYGNEWTGGYATMGDSSILGYDEDGYLSGRGYTTSKGTRKEVFPYGNIVSKTQEDGSSIETINITAKNHPLYGNTYTRTSTRNPERKTVKPIEDLQSLLTNYSYAPWNSPATPSNVASISIKEGKPVWRPTSGMDFQEAIEEGWLKHKDGSSLSKEEEKQLFSEFKKIEARFKRPEITSTKLNKK